MPGSVSVSVRLSPQWRDAAGRFARPPVAQSIDGQLVQLGREGTRLLANATPIGRKAKPADQRMRARWRSTLVPRTHTLRLTNLASYWTFVTFGTRRQRPNPALRRVIERELPRLGRVAATQVGREISRGLRA